LVVLHMAYYRVTGILAVLFTKKANPSAAYGVVCESSVSFFASVFATRRHHLEQTVRTHDLIGRRVFCF
jgi:hypothetical protein